VERSAINASSHVRLVASIANVQNFVMKFVIENRVRNLVINNWIVAMRALGSVERLVQKYADKRDVKNIMNLLSKFCLEWKMIQMLDSCF
jgi:hypothetical protein